ncbi:MAG: hypothetical protein H7A20_10610 [Rhodanobacteraceae bacterium]|nr:hypothetical protein [Rhodanobacteraceae bacterium]
MSKVSIRPIRNPIRRQPVPRVTRVDDASARCRRCGRRDWHGRHGTKLEAASAAANRGIPTALFNSRDATVLAALAEGVLHGTFVEALSDRLTARKQWLRHAPSAGRIRWMPAR